MENMYIKVMKISCAIGFLIAFSFLCILHWFGMYCGIAALVIGIILFHLYTLKYKVTPVCTINLEDSGIETTEDLLTGISETIEIEDELD